MLQRPSVVANKLPIFSAPQTRAPGDFDWFVYGSSLDADAFAHWAAEHGYAVPDFSKASKARLDGWRIAFNVRSNFWGGLVASLVADSAAHVEGLLVPMAAAALGMVRHKEGVLSGLYEERDVTIGGKAAKVYIASASRVVPEGAPAPRYRETLVAGAKTHGLSPAWIAALEKA